jgi:chromosome partitioning protein
VLYAISQADFVDIPMQGSHEDAKAASRAVQVIRQSEKMTRRSKPHAVLLTRTNSLIRSRNLSHILKGVVDAGVPMLQTELNDRDAFKALFAFQGTLDDMSADAVPNLDKAKLNVAEFAQELVQRIVEQQRGRKKEDDEITAVAGAA